MTTRRVLTLVFAVTVLGWCTIRIGAQENPADDKSTLRVVVDLVQLNIAVTDNKGEYVTGLKPSDFIVTEDRIGQKIATFEEGNQGQVVLDASGVATPAPIPPPASANVTSQRDAVNTTAEGTDAVHSAVSGADVFILFDKSNYMYRGFVFAQDAIADFVRSLDHPDRVAFYSYSRDVSRDATLTADRDQVLRGVRTTVAGDDAALYNALLMTLKDAAQHSGRKVIVVFSNGPDNSSMVPPEGVGEMAQSMGIPIYMISTRTAKFDPISSVVFQRMSDSTGGQAYFAKDWKEQQKAFASIRNDLAHLYSLSYYPQFNPNRGWRTISVKLAPGKQKNYHIRTRNGYRPLPSNAAPGFENDAVATSGQ